MTSEENLRLKIQVLENQVEVLEDQVGWLEEELRRSEQRVLDMYREQGEEPDIEINSASVEDLYRGRTVEEVLDLFRSRGKDVSSLEKLVEQRDLCMDDPGLELLGPNALPDK